MAVSGPTRVMSWLSAMDSIGFVLGAKGKTPRHGIGRIAFVLGASAPAYPDEDRRAKISDFTVTGMTSLTPMGLPMSM